MRMTQAGVDVEVAEGLDMVEAADIGGTTSVAEAVMGGGNLRVLTELSLHSVGVLRAFFLGLLAVYYLKLRLC